LQPEFRFNIELIKRKNVNMSQMFGDSGHDEFINWYESLHSMNVLFMFKGDFNQDLINSIVKLADNMSELASEDILVKQRLTGIIVECLQNICRHGEDFSLDKMAKPGIILLRKLEGSYILNFGNSLSLSKVESMKSYINKINNLDNDGLKSYHKEVLQNAELYGKYGADIGLINIAKNSEKKFNYNFHNINDHYSFFSIEVFV